MNMLLPDQFVRVAGAKVKIVVFDISPLREDYCFSQILLCVLRDLALDTDILIDYSDDVLNEVSLSEKRIQDALALTDADLLVFGSYVATRSNVQPMIHLVCSYGRPMQNGSILPEGIDLGQAILEGDAILQMPRHILLRDVLPVMAIESLSYQNSLAEDIFRIARFIQAIKLYKAEKFKETAQLIDSILGNLGPSEEWPGYWVPFCYLHMLGGMVQLRLGDAQRAVYTLSNALTRSTPAKMRIQRIAEQVISSLIQEETPGPAGDPEPDAEPK